MKTHLPSLHIVVHFFAFSLFFQPGEVKKKPEMHVVQLLEALNARQEHQFRRFNYNYAPHGICFRQSVFVGVHKFHPWSASEVPQWIFHLKSP